MVFGGYPLTKGTTQRLSNFRRSVQLLHFTALPHRQAMCPLASYLLLSCCTDGRHQVKTLSSEEMLAVSKAFAHFFSLANAADNHHRYVSRFAASRSQRGSITNESHASVCKVLTPSINYLYLCGNERVKTVSIRLCQRMWACPTLRSVGES